MKTTRLIEKFQKLVSKSPEETPIKKLHKTVKALKNKQKELEMRLKRTEDKHVRQRLKQKIDVLRVQRRKGIDLYKTLKAERDKEGGR